MNTLMAKPEGRLAKAQIVQLLDSICRAIEPTETHYRGATERYQTIGQFLAEEGSPLSCYEPSVYPQGSMRIKAAIRPINGKEFDVDLVCEFKRLPHVDPKAVKKLIWDRFRYSDRYKSMAIEKNRCVQIQYAGDFHMDVMPCVPGRSGWAQNGAVWVPDKQLDDWKPSNPVGFALFVEAAAAKVPRQTIALSNRATVRAKATDVQPLDTSGSFSKPALIRIIQILKRHRDEFFKNNHDKAPISVIITTLATQSYDRTVTLKTFEDVYDLLLEVVEGMLNFIRINPITGEISIANPTHPDENFAEKWNRDASLAQSFYTWHKRVVAGIKVLAEQDMQGLDKVGTFLENLFGASAANQAVRAFSASVRNDTAIGRIAVTSRGLVTPAAFGIATVTKNPPHTNHGS